MADKTIQEFRTKVLKLKELGITYAFIARQLGITRSNLNWIMRQNKTLKPAIWERFKEVYG